MSDEVKPRRHRRRGKSRRKRSAIALMFNPARAPLGTVNVQPRDGPRIVSVPGAWPEDGEEHNGLQLPPSTTPTQPPQPPSSLPSTPSKHSTSRPLPSTPVSFDPKIFDTPLSLRFPGPAVLPASSSRSFTQSYACQPEGDSCPIFSPSPLRIKACRSLPSMTIQKASIYPRMYGMPGPDEPHELDDFNQLASSQPVSLSQLCARANPRMKPSRPPKRLQLDSSDDNDTDSRSSVVIRRPAHYRPQTRMSMIHHANSKGCGLNIYKTEVLKPDRYGLERRSQVAGHPEQDSWHEQMDIHSHRNPLGYATDYGSPFTCSIAQPDVSNSGSPFLKRDQCHGEYGTWPADKFSKMLFFDPSLENSYAIFSSEKAQLSESSLSLYRDSFDRPEGQSPYESLRVQRSGYNPHDIRDITANLQSSFAEIHPEQHPAKYKAVVCDNMGRIISRESGAHLGQVLPRPESPVRSPVHTPDNGMRPRQSSDSLPTEENSSAQREDLARILSERINACIQEISERSRFDEKQDEEECVSNGCDYCAPAIPDDADSLSSRGMNRKSSDKQPGHGLSVAPHNDSKDDFLRPLPLRTSTNQPEAGAGYLYEELMEKMTRSAGVSAPSSSDMATRTIRPPPGIPDPVVRNTALGPSYLDQSPHSVEVRLREANAWFHADGRGEEQLRQQVADIADNYASRIARLEGLGGSSSSSTMAKQKTLLLGDAIINLHSYVSQDSVRQMGNFSNFGRVRPRHCEPSLGGRRSYFDCDPSMDHWSLPSSRAISGMGQSVE